MCKKRRRERPRISNARRINKSVVADFYLTLKMYCTDRIRYAVGRMGVASLAMAEESTRYRPLRTLHNPSFTWRFSLFVSFLRSMEWYRHGILTSLTTSMRIKSMIMYSTAVYSILCGDNNAVSHVPRPGLAITACLGAFTSLHRLHVNA